MRIFLFVINGLGVGSLPDYSKYDTEYNCTSLNVSGIEDCAVLNKLGLFKCCLKDMDKSTLGYCFRGRWLTTDTTYESGLNEILGNMSFNNSCAENLIDYLKRHNVNVRFLSSKIDGIANEIFDNDTAVIESCIKTDFSGDSVVICELNDFAQAGLLGDICKLQSAICNIDNKLDNFINNVGYDDIVFISGNFGINPTKIGITREYSTIFVYSKKARRNANLRTVQGGSSIAMTIVDLLNIYPNSMSFADDILRKNADNNLGDRLSIAKGKVKELKPKITVQKAIKNKPSTDKTKVIKVKIVKDRTK